MDLYKTFNAMGDGIFLSGVMGINPDTIARHNIKHIICCTSPETSAAYHVGVSRLCKITYINLQDYPGQSLWQISENKPAIERIYQLINNSSNFQENVLVHCYAGVSRSVSAVIYYLMKKYGYGFDKALNYVKMRRQIANPNTGFVNQLRAYDVKRHNFTSYDADAIVLPLR